MHDVDDVSSTIEDDENSKIGELLFITTCITYPYNKELYNMWKV